MVMQVVFRDPSADWKERCGYWLLSATYAKEGYTEVTLGTPLECKEVEKKVLSVVRRIFLTLANLFTFYMGRTALYFSATYAQKLTQLQEPSKIEPEEPSLALFDQAVNRWSFLEGAIEEYSKVISAASENPRLAAFFRSELTNLEAELITLMGEKKELIQVFNEKITDVSALKQIEALVDNIQRLKTQHTDLLEQLRYEAPIKVQGLANGGNTCYMNSALQPLLAVERFCDLAASSSALPRNPTEKDEEYAGRVAIFSALQKVFVAYKEDKDVRALGQLVVALRATMFTVGLGEGGFVERSKERSYQDAGSFFELVLHVLGQGFQLRSERLYPRQGMQGHSLKETTPQGCLYLKTSGSVQDKIKTYAKPFTETVSNDNALRHTPEGGTSSILLKTYTETNRIVTSPKDLLVLRVETYKVDLSKDQSIDCSALFEESPKAEYELVGFAQNHSQVHWTSVARRGDKWFYCNDSQVEEVTRFDRRFQQPANYLVYRKK